MNFGLRWEGKIVSCGTIGLSLTKEKFTVIKMIGQTNWSINFVKLVSGLFPNVLFIG